MIDTSVIIVAGGSGTRLGHQLPKAFVPLAGKPLFSYSLLAFDSCDTVSETILVIPAGMKDSANQVLRKLPLRKSIAIVEGGAQRWQSVANGLAACTDQTSWVMVHDAARPFVSHETIGHLIAKSETYRCAVTATPVTDTIRRVAGDRSLGTIDRSTLVRIGTPQLFDKQLLCRALTQAGTMDPPPTDEAMLIEQMGIDVGIAEGDPVNFKVTTPADYRIAQALIGLDSPHDEKAS